MIFISGSRLISDKESCLNPTDDYIYVNSCGYDKCVSRSINTLRKDGRPDFQIIYITNGFGSFLVNGVMTELDAGNIIIYRPGEIQQYTYQLQNTPEAYWVHFAGYGADDVIIKVGLSNSQVHNIGLSSICIDYFTQIIHELQFKSPLFEYAANATLLSLLTCMGRYAADMKNPKNRILSEGIKKVIKQMHNNYNNNWTISTLADQSNLSPSWFMHSFKEQVGMSPMEYLTSIRLDKAKWLIINSSLSIKEISNIIGYDDPLSFSKLFKKVEGVSPALYRKSNT